MRRSVSSDVTRGGSESVRSMRSYRRASRPLAARGWPWVRVYLSEDQGQGVAVKLSLVDLFYGATRAKGWALAHGSVSNVSCRVGQCTRRGGAPVRSFGSSPLQMASIIVPSVIVPGKRRLSARAKGLFDDVDIRDISRARSTLCRKARIAFT
eukprot:7288958-Pyramimonas_sp.AAC.1